MSKKTFPVNAMVLAAGLGVRLRPLTEKMPKPLIPVGNCPMLKIVLDNLAEAGIKHFAINTHYLAEQIVDFVNASSYKTAVTTFHEPEILGTGGGPVNAKAMLSEHEYFIIHNSDILTDINLRKLLEHHFSSGNKITMAVLDGPENKLRVTPDGKIHDILDSLGCSPPGNRLLTYSGIMILHRDIFRYLPQQPENCSIIKAILAMMAAEPGCAGAYLEENCYWNDLGTLPQYFKAHHDVMIAKKLKLPAFFGIPEILVANDAKIDPTAELTGFVAVGSKSVINARAVLINCILLEGAAVKANDFHCNEIIMPDFCVHRNFHELSRMKVLSGVDLKKQRLSSLQEQGSARGFYRVSNGEESKILMVSDGMDQDFERFIYIGRFLGQFDFPTPLIYACEPEEFTILTEDLGNDTLSRLAFRHYNAEQLETVYRKGIDALVDFQSRGTGLFIRNDAPILRNF
ncbi:MAG: sugar phosphate nucleotidyltransferase, partial [Victivallaceae bacterium]